MTLNFFVAFLIPYVSSWHILAFAGNSIQFYKSGYWSKELFRG